MVFVKDNKISGTTNIPNRTSENAHSSDNNNDVTSNVNINDTKRKRHNDNMDLPTAKLHKNNYYAVLDTDNDVHCDQLLLKQFEKHVQENKLKSKKINTTSVTTNNLPNTTNNNSTQQVKNNSSQQVNSNTVVNNEKNKKKVPPINIVDIETKQLIEFLEKGLKIKEFRYKKSLFMNSLEDFLRVKAYLEKTKAKFFTFTPKGIKTKTYLLKGLDNTIDINEILEELCSFQEEDLEFIKVSKFITKPKKNAEGNVPMLPIYLVQITPDSNVHKLKNIKALFHRFVKWEQVRRPEIPQCRNCQGFFHSASNCFLPSKCVKCNNEHEKGKCTISIVPAEERDKLYCVLCNKYGHPASYKGCEKYKQLQQKLIAKKKLLTDNRTNNMNTFTNPETSFASALRGNTNNNNNNNLNNQLNSSLIQELKNMMLNLNNQMASLQKQIQLQASRIDTIFSMLDV